MPTYVVLGHFTQQGIQTIKNLPNRLQAANKAIESVGGKMVSTFYTMGQYDLVAIVEAPDDESITRIALAVGAAGNVRTETLRAFTGEQMQQIAARLPG